MNRLMTLMAAIILAVSAQAQVMMLSEAHAMKRVNTNQRYLLLPVQEKEEIAHVKVICQNQVVKELNVRLAVDHVDYLVPLDLQDPAFNTNQQRPSTLLLDIMFGGNRRTTGAMKDYVCWQRMVTSDTFDTQNVERFRPAYHHTPLWGWMNDPNGMFYKDGVWHLYFQFNPFGSQWENMTWGHSTSRDLIHWEYQGTPIEADALGTIFSGSCVVDKNNTSGYGNGSVVAFYTSAGANQTQSMAWSADGGKTFTKYAANPILSSDIPDFRDPKAFWNDDIQRWNLILAAGQEMRIYSSANLRDWKYESSFGLGYGNHDGVWECPDMRKMTVKGTGEQKWMLICNINPGGPFGGSATQYFIGDFDGHRFSCDSKPSVTKWMDYGKDHYATVTFDNAPDGRHVALAWMSNWQYANQVPTRQFRSANSIPRDLGLFQDGNETYVSVVPSPEMQQLRGKKLKTPTETCEMVVDVKGSATLTLSNEKGESVVMTYDDGARTFSMDRTKAGDASFSDAFSAVTTAPTHGQIRQLRIFIDRCSIEVFDAEGRMAMTNLVFPTTAYNKVKVKGGKATVYEVKY
ncbi:MAG: DUF4980 domain-containing protein [Prevotella sp.]|nr:DUF4980 domain-containing protein [Prevotella sp.]